MKCRQATRLISDAQERQLMTKEKIGLNLHLAICRHCRKLTDDEVKEVISRYLFHV